MTKILQKKKRISEKLFTHFFITLPAGVGYSVLRGKTTPLPWFLKWRPFELGQIGKEKTQWGFTSFSPAILWELWL